MRDQVNIQPKGRIRVIRKDTGEVLLDIPNVVVNGIKSLFARMFANISEPKYGVWGLALGTGDPLWAPETQPDATALQSALVTPVLRKVLSNVRFVDQSLNPVATISEIVDFQTTVNATTDNIIGISIRELGLIGGGSASSNTDMTTAAFWDDNVLNPNSATLLTYKTLPPIIFPPGIDIIVSWVLTF